MNNADMPINPSDTTYETSGGEEREIFTGLTKREHFAGLAMQGFIRDISVPQSACISKVVNLSVAFADELLKELEK